MAQPDLGAAVVADADGHREPRARQVLAVVAQAQDAPITFQGDDGGAGLGDDESRRRQSWPAQSEYDQAT